MGFTRRIVFISDYYRRHYFETHSRLREGGLNQFSPECGPWTNMCMAWHRRSAANCFLGDQSFEFVRKANTQMAVVALMLFLTAITGGIGRVEQKYPHPAATPTTVAAAVRVPAGWGYLLSSKVEKKIPSPRRYPHSRSPSCGGTRGVGVSFFLPKLVLWSNRSRAQCTKRRR